MAINMSEYNGKNLLNRMNGQNLELMNLDLTKVEHWGPFCSEGGKAAKSDVQIHFESYVQSVQNGTYSQEMNFKTLLQDRDGSHDLTDAVFVEWVQYDSGSHSIELDFAAAFADNVAELLYHAEIVDDGLHYKGVAAINGRYGGHVSIAVDDGADASGKMGLLYFSWRTAESNCVKTQVLKFQVGKAVDNIDCVQFSPCVRPGEDRLTVDFLRSNDKMGVDLIGMGGVTFNSSKKPDLLGYEICLSSDRGAVLYNNISTTTVLLSQINGKAVAMWILRSPWNAYVPAEDVKGTFYLSVSLHLLLEDGNITNICFRSVNEGETVSTINESKIKCLTIRAYEAADSLLLINQFNPSVSPPKKTQAKDGQTEAAVMQELAAMITEILKEGLMGGFNIQLSGSD